MSAARPRMPAGLGTAGRKLWRSVTGTYDLEPHEAEILALACHQADVAEQLAAQAEADGLIVAGASGQRRHHPALTEARLSSVAAARIIASLKLPAAPAGEAEEAEPVRESPTTRKARHAAEVRWRRARGGAA